MGGQVLVVKGGVGRPTFNRSRGGLTSYLVGTFYHSMKTTSRRTRRAKKFPPDLWCRAVAHGSSCRWHGRVSSRQMMPQIVWSGDENYIGRPVCESTTSTCKHHGVGIYVCYMPTRFVGRREVWYGAFVISRIGLPPIPCYAITPK